MWETGVWSLGLEDPLEKEMATHPSTLAWKTPWMEEPGRLQPMWSQRVGHDWVTSPSLFHRLKNHKLWDAPEQIQSQLWPNKCRLSLVPICLECNMVVNPGPGTESPQNREQPDVGSECVLMSYFSSLINVFLTSYSRDVPGGPVAKNMPVNTGDTGLIPGPGRSHMLLSN